MNNSHRYSSRSLKGRWEEVQGFKGTLDKSRKQSGFYRLLEALYAIVVLIVVTYLWFAYAWEVRHHFVEHIPNLMLVLLAVVIASPAAVLEFVADRQGSVCKRFLKDTGRLITTLNSVTDVVHRHYPNVPLEGLAYSPSKREIFRWSQSMEITTLLLRSRPDPSPRGTSYDWK